MKCSVKAPAKINLSLEVLAKRPDGYHEVEMIMTEVDLADRLDFTTRNDGQIVVEMSEGFIPLDTRNLAYQAARVLKDRFQVKEGATIHIQKNIPVAAGLAGGSSNAAAVLRALNDMWNLSLSKEELAEIGALIGSDVAFCVHGGTAKALGRGEKIEKLPTVPPCWVVLAKPPIGVSTGDIYRHVWVSERRHSPSAEVENAIYARDYGQICNHLHNDLESVTLALYPEVGRIKQRMVESGIDAALMSGSGPTVFGLAKHEGQVQRVYNALRGFCERVYAVRLLTSETC
ncbi:4-(cytidine 5'-diphospho)-2-C-methyl-D-erythritol kinase [Natribacillus halophilus]|uniref:4-diphosphocytidyl-2-C-methyl-D-erythritol kinase n=1 Tax=Natribacillus halophilus TaxID=549003 RepID=A0A1G8RK36_9BACI|nr:4-(cytidine 5'-diphospho)-2-C-methyl-D-erythritol kinase [Natribacillus halophilus]SDJ17311.1 4-diphosphocytidyl-2-C-methyl-D-erythritol kinase [Natribacillus halophilus]